MNEEPPPGALRPRILYIDDDHDAHLILRRYLRDEPIELLVSSDGLAGIRMVKDATPDLVILDLGIPNGSGQTVLNVLRASPDFTGQILVITGNQSPKAKKEALESGADLFLVKPVPKEFFLEACYALLWKDGPIEPNSIPRRSASK